MAATGVFSGDVTGLSLANVSGSSTTAFCRKVSGGSFSYDPNLVRNRGIGGQTKTMPGIGQATLDFTCTGVLATDLAKWFPTAAGVQVASFPAASGAFFIEVDDGTNGQEWLLSGCQPASVSVAIAEGQTSEVEITFGVLATTATLQAKSAIAPSYNAFRGHSIGHVTAQIGSANHKIVSFNAGNNLGTVIDRTMDTGGDFTVGTGAYITTQDPTFSCVTREPYKMALGSTTILDAAEHLDENVVLTMANGNASQNITMTYSNMVPGPLSLPFTPEGLNGFPHEFVFSGNVAAHSAVWQCVAIA